MPWVYLDDHFDEHPKVLAAREIHRDAPWLFVSGLCYTRRANSDGLIIAPQVPRLITHYQPRAASALLETELWEDAGKGSMMFHDYRDWNLDKGDRSASARNAAQIRWARERERKGQA